MKQVAKSLLLFLVLLSCKQESSDKINLSKEVLSVEAEAKVVNWIGYKTFSFELKDIVDNFSKAYLSNNMKKLISASNSLLYSMPNELRNDIMNEKAGKLIELTKSLTSSVEEKTEDQVKKDLQDIIKAFNTLNDEINYSVRNKEL